MYPCPREILLHIFQFACDDDGTTGRTLSLVSRQFYQLTQNCKYRSIALVGLPQIASFVAMLEQLPKIPPVRHLFLSSVTQNATNGRQRITDAMQTYRETCDSFSQVLTVLAPTLVTCSVVSHLARLATMIPVSCPNLIELTLDGPFPILPPNEGDPYFPSLRKITFSNFTDYPSSLFKDIAKQAPHVQSLSFLFANACRNFPNDLAEALDVPTTTVHRSESDSVSSLPPSLQQIVVQVGSSVDPEAQKAYSLHSVQQLMERKLSLVQSKDKRRRVSFLSAGPRILPQDALISWLYP